MASLKADKPVGTQLFGQAKKLKKLLLLKLVILVHHSSKGPASKSAPKQKPQESKKKVYAYILFHNSDQHIKMLHIYMYMVALMMTYSVDCYYVLTQTKLFLIFGCGCAQGKGSKPAAKSTSKQPYLRKEKCGFICDLKSHTSINWIQ